MTVRILSARHSLLDPDTRIEPYDRKITYRDAVPETVVADHLTPLAKAGGVDIHAFLPRPCLAKLSAAREILERGSRRIRVHDHYLR